MIDKPEGQPARVLIVDDNVALAENIAEILESGGYATEVAASAEEALTRAVTHPISVVITDFRLPGISGADLVRRLRRDRKSLPALVISAYSDDVTMDDARDAGADFMAKPVNFLALNEFVRSRSGAGS
jgi:DNA-binding response OmpR family regulator